MGCGVLDQNQKSQRIGDSHQPSPNATLTTPNSFPFRKGAIEEEYYTFLFSAASRAETA